MANSLSREEVLKLAKLSKLVLSEKELAEMQIELSKILDFVSRLSEVDVSDLNPTDQITGLKNILREDRLNDYGYNNTLLLDNVPHKLDQYIQVPKMLNES